MRCISAGPHRIVYAMLFFTIIFALLSTGVFAQAEPRGIEDLVVEPVESAGALIEIIPGERLSISQLAESTPGFFERFRAPLPRYDVQSYRLKFLSTDFDGSEVLIHAQFFVPLEATQGSDEGLPAYIFASGTTGISDESAPSLEVPELERWGWYTQNMLAYAAQGYLVLFPDYTGFHDPERVQRYFSKYAEGYMMLDAIRVLYRLLDLPELQDLGVSSNGHVFTAGYSQGGHAAMAAADLRPYYAPEVPLSGVITYGSTNDVEALLREGVAYGPLIFHSYREMYGSDLIRIEEYLLPKWLPDFETQSQGRLPQFQATYGFAQEGVFLPEFRDALNNGTMERDYPGLHRILAENHSGLSGHGLPALVIQGGLDFIVTNITQALFVQQLREAGSRVRFLIFPHSTHRYTRHSGFFASLSWMEDVMARTAEQPE